MHIQKDKDDNFFKGKTHNNENFFFNVWVSRGDRIFIIRFVCFLMGCLPVSDF